MSNDKRDGWAIRLGDEAEAIFDGWSRRTGFNNARQEPDRFGVDRWVEIDLDLGASSRTLDHRNGPVSCQVQIKGTNESYGATDIALGIWERLAKSPLPTFVVGIQLDGDLAYVRSHLIHVGRAEIAAVLRRLRSVTPKDAASLHRMTLRRRWTRANALTEPAHSGFVRRVRESIGEPVTYAERKSAWRTTAGYVGASVAVAVEIAASEREIVEAVLGDRARLPVRVLRATETRFGIPAPAPGFEHPGPFHLGFEPLTPTSAELIVETPTSRAALRGGLVTSHVAGLPIAADAHIWRFETPTLRVDVSSKAHPSMTILHKPVDRPSAAYPLRELTQGANIIINLARTERRIQLRRAGVSVLELSHGTNSDLIREHAAQALCCRWASYAAAAAGIADDVPVRLDDLCAQADQLRNWGVYFDRAAIVHVDIPEDEPMPPEPVTLAPYWVRLGDEVIVQPLAFRGEIAKPERPNHRSYRLLPKDAGPAVVLQRRDLAGFDPFAELSAVRTRLVAQSATLVDQGEMETREEWAAFVRASR